jgi:hypothetical protein
VAAVTVAELPALPLHTAGRYVAAAYVVAFALVLIYMAIMAIRLSHIERDLGELLTLAEQDDEDAPVSEPRDPQAAPAETAPAETAA